MRSNAPARSASKTHRRLGLAPLATLKMAPIASWQPRPGRNPYDLGSNPASHSGSHGFTTRARNTLSRITGIPSGRRFPALPLLGIYTRLTGRACHGPVWRCTQSAISAFTDESSTTFPSTPAVLRPALSSGTRRTLTSVLARERSINFCKLRTRLKSPTRDAVKIRCRKRRTSSSAARQLMACQSRGSSSGPFTTPTSAIVACAPPVVCVAMVSNLPFGSDFVVSVCTQAHLARVSTLSGPGTTSRIRPVIPRTAGGGTDPHALRFPAAFRLPALASRAIPYPPGDWAFLTVGLPGTTSCPDPVGVTTFHTRKLRPGRVPPISRGRRYSPGRYEVLDRRLPLFDGSAPIPRSNDPSARLPLTRHQRRSTRFTRPALPSPVTPMDETGTLGLEP